MLLENRKHGLVLEHKPHKRFEKSINDPLKLVLPQTPSSAGEDKKMAHPAHETQQPWEYTYTNGIEADMYGLRSSHNHGNLQTWTSGKLKKRVVTSRASHGVLVNWGTRYPPFRAQTR